MSEYKRSMIRGHEPLRVPSNWKSEDRAFVVQLERLLDDIYSRFGRLGMKDLSPELQEAIGESYELPLAGNGVRGGVQTGFTASGKNYPVELEDEKMFVNVPWETTPVYNGLDKTDGGFALDARQGKTLNDKISPFEIPSTIASNLNNCVTPGFYRATRNETTNKPNENNHYTVLVSPYCASYMSQIAVDVNNGEMWRRSNNNGSWTRWERLVTESELFYTQAQSYTMVTDVCGFVSNSTKSMYLHVPLPNNISRTPASITKLEMIVRGTSGYVDVFSAATDAKTLSGYTVSSARRNNTMLRIQIDKTTAFTNVTNNTPIVAQVSNLTFTA